MSKPYHIRKWALLKRGICVRCRWKPLSEGTCHCEDCLAYFQSRYTPKAVYTVGRRPLPRKVAA